MLHLVTTELQSLYGGRREEGFVVSNVWQAKAILSGCLESSTPESLFAQHEQQPCKAAAVKNLTCLLVLGSCRCGEHDWAELAGIVTWMLGGHRFCQGGVGPAARIALVWVAAALPPEEERGSPGTVCCFWGSIPIATRLKHPLEWGWCASPRWQLAGVTYWKCKCLQMKWIVGNNLEAMT